MSYLSTPSLRPEVLREVFRLLTSRQEATLARSNGPRADEPAPTQAEVPAEDDRGSQGRPGGWEGETP